MDVVPIKGKAYDRRMSQPLIVRVAVEAFGAVWVAVVVVVVSFPRVSIAPVDLTGDPGGCTSQPQLLGSHATHLPYSRGKRKAPLDRVPA